MINGHGTIQLEVSTHDMESLAVLDQDEVVHRVKRFKVGPCRSISSTGLMGRLSVPIIRRIVKRRSPAVCA